MTDEREERRERPLSTADMVKATERNEPDESMREQHDQDETRAEEEKISLLSSRNVEDFRSRWNSVQAHFVDEPRSSVEEADSLVAEVMKEIAQMFASERSMLEDHWTRGDDVSTEDLRIALQRYRSFFNRLLSIQ
jgi:hypothetical protein